MNKHFYDNDGFIIIIFLFFVNEKYSPLCRKIISCLKSNLPKYFEFQLIDYGLVKTMIFKQLNLTIFTENLLQAEIYPTQETKLVQC